MLSLMLLFCAKATMKSHNYELAHLKKKKKEERRIFLQFGDFWFGTFTMLFHPTMSLAGHENTRRCRYIVIKAYKVYQLYDRIDLMSKITCQAATETWTQATD